MATLIKTDGTTEKLTDLSLEKMQEAVGGYIEILRSRDGKTLFVCNEEGKLYDLIYNPVATYTAIECGALANDILVGNVIMASYEEIN